MNFKPLSKRYEFDDTLSMDIGAHIKEPIINWMRDLLKDMQIYVDESAWGPSHSPAHITSRFKEVLQVNLREVFPQRWGNFVEFVMNDKDRTLTIIQWSLVHYAKQSDANRLEWILSNAGSGYAVKKVNQQASEYDRGAYDLVERVPEVVKKASEAALSAHSELMRAWVACYGIKQNYNEAVGACQNVLESMLRDKYLPKDTKAQLGKLIGDIKAGKKLDFLGSDILSDSNVMLDLIEKVPGYRGLHKAGTGQDATKSVAEYVLHTTIYLWNLHADRSET